MSNPGRGDNDSPPDAQEIYLVSDLVRQLVARGANVNTRMTKKANVGRTNLNVIGATPFLVAARGGGPFDAFPGLLGAEPLLANADNTSPFLVAAGVGNYPPGHPGTDSEVTEAVKVALELDGDVNAVDNHGETVIHAATYKQGFVRDGDDASSSDERGGSIHGCGT